MVTVKYDKRCNLCGLPVEIEGFSLVVDKKALTFCCAGCLSIYQLIYTNCLSTDTHQPNTNKEEN